MRRDVRYLRYRAIGRRRRGARLRTAFAEGRTARSLPPASSVGSLPFSAAAPYAASSSPRPTHKSHRDVAVHLLSAIAVRLRGVTFRGRIGRR